MWETPITVPGFRPSDDDLQRCRRETVPAGVPLHLATPVPPAAMDDQPEPLPPPPLPPTRLAPLAPQISLDVLRAALEDYDGDDRPTRPMPAITIDALATTVDLPAIPRPAGMTGWADLTSAVQMLALRAIELPIGAAMLQRDSSLRRRRIIQVALTLLVLVAVPWETRPRTVQTSGHRPEVEALASRPAPMATCVSGTAASGRPAPHAPPPRR